MLHFECTRWNQKKKNCIFLYKILLHRLSVYVDGLIRLQTPNFEHIRNSDERVLISPFRPNTLRKKFHPRKTAFSTYLLSSKLIIKFSKPEISFSRLELLSSVIRYQIKPIAYVEFPEREVDILNINGKCHLGSCRGSLSWACPIFDALEPAPLITWPRDAEVGPTGVLHRQP